MHLRPTRHSLARFAVPLLAAIPVAILCGITWRDGPGAPQPARAQDGAGPSAACPDNLLANPDFDGGFRGRGRIAEVVAVGWTSWYATLPGTDGINYPPDFAPRRRDRDGAPTVFGGRWSQELATQGATHEGGLWQRVAVPPGSQVRAVAWAYGWATDGDDPSRSEPPGTYALAIGIDPEGRGDPYAQGIVWTAPITVTDTWVPLSLDLPIEGSLVTLILRGQPLRILKHNVSRWDGACLTASGRPDASAEPPTPTARPTRTPRPPDPGAPTHTPNAATIEAMAMEIARATGRSDDLRTRVALIAATAGAGDGPGAPGEGARVMRGIPGAAAEPPARERGDDSSLGGESGPSLAERVADHLGAIALALAAVVGGVLVGLRRSE